MTTMKTIRELTTKDISLFIQHYKKHIDYYTMEEIHKGLDTPIDKLTSIFKEIGLRYTESGNQLEVFYELIGKLNAEVGVSGVTKTLTEEIEEEGMRGFNLEIEKEREELTQWLEQYDGYKIIYFESSIFQIDSYVDLKELVNTFKLLTQLDTNQQKLFADVYVNGYNEVPTDLVKQIIKNLN